MIKQLLNSIIPGWITEYQFDNKRKWRFDFAHIELKIAVEIEGGVYVRGRHTRGKGYIADMGKYNQAQLQGWKVLRYTPTSEQLGMMVKDIKRLIGLMIEEKKDE